MSTDAVAITNLLYIYAERFDAGDFAGAAALFEHSDIKLRGKIIHGSDALLKFFETNFQLQAGGSAHVMHIVTNPIVEIAEDGAKATSRSYYTVIQATPAIPLQPISAGRYLDAFEKVDGKWRFCEREYVLTLIGDFSAYRPKPQPV